jgi:hypothetical protein
LSAGNEKWELMMASEIKPGQWINVKVTAVPRSAGGKKTMTRLFEKDRQVRAERRRLSKSRQPRSHIRGGRPWFDRPAQLAIVDAKPGSSYKIFGSVDVLRELESLKGCVEITPA